MITSEEINLCMDYLMKHPDEAQEFLKTIGIKNSTRTYPTTFSIYDEKKGGRMYTTTCSEDALYNQVLTLCSKKNATISYSVLDKGKDYGRVFYDSDYTAESIKSTLEDWLTLFYSRAYCANSHDLYIVKQDIVLYSIYGNNEYVSNCEDLYGRIIPRLREIPVCRDFSDALLKVTEFGGYNTAEFVSYMNRCLTKDANENLFIERLKDMYKGACCYPHEVKYRNNVRVDAE